MVFAIEALTNPRIRDEIGQLQLVPPEERVGGAGSTVIMAAFTHLNPEGSRFSDGSYGVYYAAQALETAIAEVSHHRAVFLRAHDEPALDVDLRLITANVDAELHDLAGAPARASRRVLDPTTTAAQASAAAARRRQLGRAVPQRATRGRPVRGVFRPKALRNAAAAHIALHWDGARITHWFEKRGPHAVND